MYAELDSDDQKEVIFGDYGGLIHVLDSNGNPKDGFPYQTGDDIWGSAAHSKMLNSIGILSGGELKNILSALKKIEKKILSGKMIWRDSLEDIHMHIENELIKLIGDTAKKIHTGRSRNDQVATDLRMYVRDEIIIVIENINDLQKTIIGLAEKYNKSIIPGFTHLQIAQPVTFGFILMAWFFMLERDKERFINKFE